MGRRATRAGKTKQYTHVHTVGKTVERSVKRDELDIIASICGTKRENIGGVISYAVDTNIYDDERAERPIEPTNGFHTTSTTTGVTGDFSAV